MFSVNNVCDIYQTTSFYFSQPKILMNNIKFPYLFLHIGSTNCFQFYNVLYNDQPYFMRLIICTTQVFI